VQNGSSCMGERGTDTGVERDDTTLRMKESGGAFYAPSPVLCVAIHGTRIAAGAQSGELYHLEVM